MNLNELRNQAYKTACDHGFHDKELNNEYFLCLVISELMEAVEADRKGRLGLNCKSLFKKDYDCYPNLVEEEKRFKCAFEKNVKDSLPDEFADIAIRLLDLAGLRSIDLLELEEPLFDKFNIIPEFVNWKSQLKETSFTERMFFLCSLLTSGESIEDVVRSSVAITFLNADILEVDLLWHISQKMKYNELRPVMHGKKY